MLSIRTIYNIVAKYHKRISTSYLSKGCRPKEISDQQLQTGQLGRQGACESTPSCSSIWR